VKTILDVKGLKTHFFLSRGIVKAVDGVSLTLAKGETLAIVGESGCGKSVTAFSIMRLVAPPGRTVAGEIFFGGKDLLLMSEEEMRCMRGNSISMIFQEPMTSLNPVFRVGEQIAEGLRLHLGLSDSEAREQTLRMLELVGIPSPIARYRDYPHQLSGGMRQRVMIAMALACHPDLVIADEPTTALDVTIQAQILELMDRLKTEREMGLILITHDLAVVAERAHWIAIMYAGRIVESADTAELFRNPLHPYTVGLLDSLPQRTQPGMPLQTIPGHVPGLLGDLPGCGFCDRCPSKSWECKSRSPELREVSNGHMVRCWKYS
jgi:peptide/nickel transport system ATP-binding protein